MALITRLSRLFQADFHAVLDRIEEPDIQLKQAIREMRFELQQTEQRRALLQHEAEQLLTLATDCKSNIVAFDEELDICFAAKKEDLARDLVRRKLETNHQLQSTEKQITTIQSSTRKLTASIDEYRQQLENMAQKLELLVTDNDSQPLPHHLEGVATGIRAEDIEIALLREKQTRSAS